MAKDPAFLFYSSDFLTGTMFMSNEQIGKYIRLLCAQHQMGALTEQHMLNICHTYDKDIWAKFTKQDDGTFINKRLHDETQKRKNFCESRRNNRNSKPKDKQVNNHMSPHMSEHMSSHMENENENENINEDIDVIDKVSNKVDKPKNKKKSIVKRTELAKGLTDEQFIDEMAKKGLHPCVKYDSPFVLLSLNHWKQLKDRFPVEGLLVEMVKVYNNWKMKNGGVRRSVNDFASVQEGWVVENAMKILNAKNSFTYDKMRKQQLLADEFKQSNQSGSTQFFNPPPPPQLTNEQ